MTTGSNTTLAAMAAPDLACNTGPGQMPPGRGNLCPVWRRYLWLTVLPVILGHTPASPAIPKRYKATPIRHGQLPAPADTGTGGSFQAAGKTFRVLSGDKGVMQEMDRAGQTVQFPVAFVIGSGKRGRGYLIQLGDELFQSPIGYYPTRNAFDLAPGFDRKDPDFTRPITIECLNCHSGKARHVAGSINRYEQPPFAEEAISCERCHGPSERHLRNPVAGSIVNPAKLRPAARDSICEQCHLAG